LLKYTFKIEAKIDPKSWDENLLKSPSSTFYQSIENLTSTSDQYFPVYISILNENNDIVGQLGMNIIQTTVLYSSPLFEFLLKIIKKITTRGTWTYGPVIHSKNNSERIKILKTLLESIDFVSKKYNLVFVEGDTSPYDNLIDETFKNELVKNGYEIQKRITFVANLNNDTETLWNNIKSNARRDVKRAEKNKLSVKKVESYNEFKNYFELFHNWAKTKGLSLKNLELEHTRLYNNILNGFETYLLAYDGDKLISALRISHFNKIAIAYFILSSYSESSSLGGPLLSWKALEWGKKNNMDYYDFTGGPLEAIDGIDKTRESSLLFYKKKWGGDQTIHYGVTKSQKKFHYNIYKLLFNLITSYHDFKSKRS
jgi:lipid II:glycine glycyltransferase (peptidoglycan interpeptide bridge formation enzyme)